MNQNVCSDQPGFRFPSIQHNIFDSPSSSSHVVKYDTNPRKKRSKMIKLDACQSPTSSNTASFKPKYTKKPDPSAPKITRPCTECGKKFWSWKALFGHMRCHPERQWRGINPPPNYRHPASSPTKQTDNMETLMTSSPTKQTDNMETLMTMEDHEIAASLLMLANGAAAASDSECGTSYQPGIVHDIDDRFECSSCKKVFGSHQALGGHRASHKNVKGCFAVTRIDACEVEDHSSYADEVLVKDNVEENSKMMAVLGHQCSICLKVFSSGQALGGHKRCHWEKVEEPLLNQGVNLLADREDYGFDLNLPAAPLELGSSASYSSGLGLDLRLGL